MEPRVLHLSTYTSGGAGRAAVSLHQAMLANNVDSTLITAGGWRFHAARHAERQIRRLQRSEWLTWRSVGRFGSGLIETINSSSADVVNLHWVTDGLLSVEDVGRISKPVVWTMHDMWPFTGTEHYAPEEPTPTRWQQGYTAANRPPGDSGPDLDKWTWDRKKASWTRPIHLAPVSNWLAESASKSSLAAHWPITTIPNVMPVETFTPGSRQQARQVLGLPDSPIIAFTSSAGVSDERKGFHLLTRALPTVRERFPDARIMVIGQSSPDDEANAEHDVMWMGHVEGNQAMAQLLQASDVVAVPSTADNLPMTACEAQSAGRAVVGFHVGGLPDTVNHLGSGYLAQPFDTEDYARGLIMAIEDARGQDVWGGRARERAQDLWSPTSVVDRYLDLYRQVLS